MESWNVAVLLFWMGRQPAAEQHCGGGTADGQPDGTGRRGRVRRWSGGSRELVRQQACVGRSWPAAHASIAPHPGPVSQRIQRAEASSRGGHFLSRHYFFKGRIFLIRIVDLSGNFKVTLILSPTPFSLRVFPPVFHYSAAFFAFFF